MLPSLTVDTVVLAGTGAETSVLLIQRARDPFRHHFALPGGFVDPHEVPIQAALRELREETGLTLHESHLVPLTLRGAKGRDPRGWTVSQPYLAVLKDVLPIYAGDDAASAEWRTLSEIEELAFDHGSILCDAVGRFWPIFQKSPIQTIRPWSVPRKLTRMAIYGGTFNPWHAGHSACIELAATTHNGDLVVVPDRSPFKANDDDTCAWKHYRQCQQHAHELGAWTFPGFLGLEQPNPTCGWFPKLPPRHRSLVIGADSLASLPRWWHAAKLIKSIRHLYVVPREADMDATSNAQLWVHATSRRTQLHWLPHHPYEGLSSTALRQA